MYIWAVCAPEIHGTHWLVLVSCGLLIWSLISSFSRQSLSSVFPAVHACFVWSHCECGRFAQSARKFYLRVAVAQLKSCSYTWRALYMLTTPLASSLVLSRTWVLSGSQVTIQNASACPRPRMRWGKASFQTASLTWDKGSLALGKGCGCFGCIWVWWPISTPTISTQYQHNINNHSKSIKNLSNIIQHPTCRQGWSPRSHGCHLWPENWKGSRIPKWSELEPQRLGDLIGSVGRLGRDDLW